MMAQHDVLPDQAAAADFIARHGGGIAASVSPGLMSRDMAVTVLKHGPRALTMDLRYDGERRIVKHFPDAGTDPDSQTAYLRERDALRIFGPGGFCPDLTHHCDSGRFLICKHIDGADFREIVDRAALEGMCGVAGRWLGEFALAAPYRETAGNWFDYLSNYPDFAASPMIGTSESFLTAFSFDRVVLAKNDGALSNLRFGSDGRLFGIDFEKAQFKPLGWDLLMTARALIRLFPEQAETITAALAGGFCRAVGDRADWYTALLRVFGIGAAFQATGGPGPSPVQEALARFNAGSDAPAQVVGAAPFRESRLVAQDAGAVAIFRAHIADLATEAVRAPLPVPPARADDAAPQLELQALCGACQGGCCSLGADRNAFIDAETVQSVLSDQAHGDTEEVTRRYLDHLPEMHVAGSCLFHGADSCALPRQMRSEVCNGFVCRSGRKFLREIQTHLPDSVLCVAGTGADLRKATRTRDGRIVEVPLDAVRRPGALADPKEG